MQPEGVPLELSLQKKNDGGSTQVADMSGVMGEKINLTHTEKRETSLWLASLSRSESCDLTAGPAWLAGVGWGGR